jgi:cohesin complex subunit SA-1/2
MFVVRLDPVGPLTRFMKMPRRTSICPRRNGTSHRDHLSLCLTAPTHSKVYRKRKEVDESENEKSDVDSEIEEEEEEDSSSDEDNDDDDEKVEEPKQRKPKSVKETLPKRDIKIRVLKESKKARTTRGKKKGSSKHLSVSFQAFTRKILLPDAQELPDTSLLAALLDIHRVDPQHKRASSSIYAERLEKISQRIVTLHQDDPNDAQKQLFDLIFRSVGGTSLLEESIILEALTENEWSEIVTQLVDEMSYTPEANVLISTASSSNTVIQEYHKIYGDFWQTLGRIALSSSPKTEDADSDSDDSPSSSLQIEVLRDVCSRLLELAGVGQPDLRYAVVFAVYQLGQAMLEESAALQEKLSVATRQHQAAQRQKSVRKAQALKQQIQKWQRVVRDLQELVDSNIFGGVFAKRYRDSNDSIRVLSLESLSKFCAIRPDLFLKGTYLKYFGWLLSDKSASVRYQAVLGLLRPLQEKADIAGMTSVIEKFAPRLADMVLDVDDGVQDQVMQLLLLLSRQGLLDSLQDDQIWEQINLRALSPDASVAVRKNALFFVLEQLEAFDPGVAVSGSSEAGDTEKIQSIASW